MTNASFRTTCPERPRIRHDGGRGVRKVEENGRMGRMNPRRTQRMHRDFSIATHRLLCGKDATDPERILHAKKPRPGMYELSYRCMTNVSGKPVRAEVGV